MMSKCEYIQCVKEVSKVVAAFHRVGKDQMNQPKLNNKIIHFISSKETFYQMKSTAVMVKLSSWNMQKEAIEVVITLQDT